MEKENNTIIRKKIFGNIIIAIAIMLYFILINLGSATPDLKTFYRCNKNDKFDSFIFKYRNNGICLS